MARVIHEHSAGGVVLVPVGRQTFVALISVQDNRVLALPKGHLEEGEQSLETAIRESLGRDRHPHPPHRAAR